VDFDPFSALRQWPAHFDAARGVGRAIADHRTGKRSPGPPIPDLHTEKQCGPFALPCRFFLRLRGIGRLRRASGARRGGSFRSCQQGIGRGGIPGCGGRAPGFPLRCFL
jgi:hypothetical protein